MKKEILEYLCRTTMFLSRIPIRLYDKDVLVETYEPFPLDFDLSAIYAKELLGAPLTVHAVLSPRLMMYGKVRDENSDFSMILGPARSVPITDNAIKDIILENHLDLAMAEPMNHYFSCMRAIPIENFMLMLSMLNGFLNQKILTLGDFYQTKTPYDVSVNIYQEMLGHSEQNVYVDHDTTPEMNFEKTVLFFVRHGQTEKLISHLQNKYSGGRPGTIAYDALRQYKNRCISMTTLVSRAAMEGGVDADTAYELFDLYLQKVEMNNEIANLNEILRAMLTDFSNRVRALHYGNTENPTINRAISFINEHLNRKMLASEIAKILRINPGYLSVKFKKTTGVSLPDYINRQKVLEAKRLLRFSEKSLVEISNYLSFSSQSYFQNLFKKNTGITPTEYRRNPID